jgi:hypothetical protein
MLSLYAELVCMMKNDLQHMLPDSNGQAVCSLAINELCRAAADFVNTAKDTGAEESKSCVSELERNSILNEVYTLAESANDALNLCRDCGDDESTPPILELQGLRKLNSELCKIDGECVTDVSSSDLDPSLMQFSDMLAWSTPENIPDPGQLVTLRKYIPVDMLQV